MTTPSLLQTFQYCILQLTFSPIYSYLIYFVCHSVFFLLFQISGVEVVIFLFYYNSNNFYEQEKVVVVGDCCYVNPMVRRTVRFLGNVRPAQNIPTID